MSNESQAIFDQEMANYSVRGNAEALTVAAQGHIGASRSLEELTTLYAAALEQGDHATAQELADELVPVRQAHAVVLGVLPGRDA